MMFLTECNCLFAVTKFSELVNPAPRALLPSSFSTTFPFAPAARFFAPGATSSSGGGGGGGGGCVTQWLRLLRPVTPASPSWENLGSKGAVGPGRKTL